MENTLGSVSLVGAGPGDPGLITARGLQRLRDADVVAYDRLVDRRLLKEARPGAELIDVGKEPAGGTGQKSIHTILIDRAHEGKRVVRLKGGDPFVFGRGGEEAQVLAMAGIPFEVVPGVTSAIAAPAYAGIPLTHRDAASYFTVVSAMEDPAKGRGTVPWDALARTGGTLALLMAWGVLPQVTARLLAAGMDPRTPAAVVRWGTEPCQQTVTGVLSNIADRAREAGLGPPVVVIIGQVVRFREEIRWYEDRPLFGKRVLVTRSREQASVLSRLLTEEGAYPIEAPAILIAPAEDYSDVDRAIGEIDSYQWLVFTGVNGVERFFRRLNELGRDARAISRTQVCAIGSVTVSALRGRGIEPDLVPPRYTSAALVESLAERGVQGAKVLIPSSDAAPDDLARGLEILGARVDRPIVYRTLMPEESRTAAREALSRGKIDVVTFTSSSTARNLVKLLGKDVSLLERPLIACIGPVTAQTAHDLGLRVGVVARRHTVKGLVEALKAHFDEYPEE